MSEEESPPVEEEQNYSLKEEIVHLDQLFVNRQLECDDVATQYQEISEQMEDIKKQQLDDSSEQDEDYAKSAVEQQKLLRTSMEKELVKYRSQISVYKSTHHEQSKIIDDLENRIEEYRNRCARLEAVLDESFHLRDAPKDVPDHPLDQVNQLDFETMQLRLEQERIRCQKLDEMNSLYRKQLDAASEVNNALHNNIDKLIQEYKRTRYKLSEKEATWRKEEQAFSVYLNSEHQRLVVLWRRVLNFRSEFSTMKSATEKDIFTVKTQVQRISHSVTDACRQLASLTSIPQPESQSDRNEEVRRLTQEVISLRLNSEAEKANLNERVQDLQLSIDGNQLALQEKDKLIDGLKRTIQVMENGLQFPEEDRPQASSSANRFCAALRDIGQVLLDDADQHTWAGAHQPNLTLLRNALLSCTSYSLIKVIGNAKFMESLVAAVRKTLSIRCHQVEEQHVKVTVHVERIQAQQKMIENLERDKQNQNHLLSKLSSQLEAAHASVKEFAKDRHIMKSSLEEADVQKSRLEQMRKTLNEQIESLNAENDRLYEAQGRLQQRVEELIAEKEEFALSEQKLKMDLSKGNSKITILEEDLHQVEKRYQDAQRKLEKVSMDKELLEQEKEEFSGNLKQLEKQRFDVDTKLHQLQKEGESLKASMLALKELNRSLLEDKEELNKSLCEATSEAENAKSKTSKDRLAFEREKQDLKEKGDSVQQRCTELEAENETVKKKVADLEVLTKEYEEAQAVIVERNKKLVSDVTTLDNQRNILESELKRLKEEANRRLDNTGKLVEERENLAREKGELTLRSEVAEKELSHLTDVVSMLRQEKEQLEKALYASQQLSSALQEEKQEFEREIDAETSRGERLEDQLNEIKRLRDAEFEAAARQKHALNYRIQQVEEEYSLLLKNVQQDHTQNIDILIREKETQRISLDAAQEKLAKQSQSQIDDLIHKHMEDIHLLKKQMILHEREMEDKLYRATADKSNCEKKLVQQKDSFERIIRDQEKKLTEFELQHGAVENKLAASVEHSNLVVEDLKREKSQLQVEFNDARLAHSNEMKELQNQLEDAQKERDAANAKISNMTLNLNSSIDERKKSEEKLEIISTSVDDVRKSREELEQQILVLEQKLNNEKKNVELSRKSHDDLKARLRKALSENSELKQTLQQTKYKVQSLESASVEHQDDHNDMKETLRELEASRIEARRESQSLRRRLVVLESANDSKDQEIGELQILIARLEEIENELRSDILKLRQKTLESEASKEAASKELSNVRRKLQDMEQKLKLQHEEFNATLQESVSGEQSYAEQRVTYERALADATEEAQNMRLKLNFAEGKVLALEKHISKLEGAKHELESKLQSFHLCIRSSFGLGHDSGFRGSSTQLLMSPFSSRRDSPTKFGEPLGVSTQESSPSHDQRPSTSATSVRHDAIISSLDVDVDLVKSAMHDYMRKLYTTERERDDLRADVTKLQRELDSAREEHRTNDHKLQTLQKEMDIASKDKKELENQLVTCKSAISHLEESVQTYEKEKRILSEKNTSLIQSVTAAEIEKTNFQSKVTEMRRSEARLKQEQLLLTEARETAEARATKAEISLRDLKTEKNEIQTLLSRKSSEVEDLQLRITDIKKFLSDAEIKNSTLQMSVERLNTLSEKHQVNTNLLQEKLRKLESSYSEERVTSHQLKKELNRLKREHSTTQHEKTLLRNETLSLRSNIADLKNQNEMAKGELDQLNETIKDYELQKVKLEGQLLACNDFMSRNEEFGKNTDEKLRELEREKFLLEEQLTRLKGGLGRNEEFRLKSEKQKSKYEKENTLLRKALDKVEKERQKTEEVASRSVLERAALGKSLSRMEIENQQLIQKVQNLQVQLVELEQRHLDRVKDLDKRQKFEMQLELERLRSTQKHMDQMLTAKDKSHRQKVVGLEQQVATLQEHLKQAHSSWRQREPTRSASVSFLNDMLNTSQQKLSESSREQLAKTLDTTFDRDSLSSPLNIGPNISSHPSSPSQRFTSTPHARRRIDKSFPS